LIAIVASAALCPQPVRLLTSDGSHVPKSCRAATEGGHPVNPVMV
jgi:hypothetical protein